MIALSRPSDFAWSLGCFAVALVLAGCCRLRPRTGAHQTCAICGYNLTGLTSSICPECGTDLTQTPGLPPHSRKPVGRNAQFVIWLLALPLLANLITAAAQPYAPRIYDTFGEWQFASLQTGVETQIDFELYRHGQQFTELDIWFNENNLPNPNARMTTVLNVNSEGTYWNRAGVNTLVFTPCRLDAPSVADCLRSIGDVRPRAEIDRDAKAIAAAATTIRSTSHLPTGVQGLRLKNTRQLAVGSEIRRWFPWAVRGLWITIGIVGLFVIHRRSGRRGRPMMAAG